MPTALQRRLRAVDIRAVSASTSGVARNDLPESGTLLIAALLLLGLAFAGSWIIAYVQPSANPREIVPWFLLAAALIVIVGLIAIIARAHRRAP